jgi:hypothetical protein
LMQSMPESQIFQIGSDRKDFKEILRNMFEIWLCN